MEWSYIVSAGCKVFASFNVCTIIMNNSSNYDDYDLIDAIFFVEVNVN